ncbi:hypothetical protein O181_013688 [Austropuccinia psidii MF-1]|uniref:Integrase catalytic domain-containing protein n=1 Tax=Austropuccinia psidii MF-1 TaxID=1389203 RepID=A0A9Q3BZ60_9BASI|nr:hypothetical protein [Austropuccinia psidii MF-1]
MENAHKRKIKKVVTDGGGEFANHQFKELANQSGFVHVIAPPYTPEHNSVAERVNRTIFDKARCLLLMSKLPKSNLPLSISSWKDTQEEDEFFECQEILEEDENQILEDLELESSEDSSESLENLLPPAARQIQITGPRHPTLINSDISTSNILPYWQRPVALLTEGDPLTYNQAITSNSREHWKEAIEKEIQCMLNLEVWEEVQIKDNYKLIGTTWVFKAKRKNRNQIIKHKAQLCAQGFSQTQGRDYTKTFAPTG